MIHVPEVPLACQSLPAPRVLGLSDLDCSYMGPRSGQYCGLCRSAHSNHAAIDRPIGRPLFWSHIAHSSVLSDPSNIPYLPYLRAIFFRGSSTGPVAMRVPVLQPGACRHSPALFPGLVSAVACKHCISVSLKPRCLQLRLSRAPCSYG